MFIKPLLCASAVLSPEDSMVRDSILFSEATGQVLKIVRQAK